jgi:hypothetical protein
MNPFTIIKFQLPNAKINNTPLILPLPPGWERDGRRRSIALATEWGGDWFFGITYYHTLILLYILIFNMLFQQI